MQTTAKGWTRNLGPEGLRTGYRGGLRLVGQWVSRKPPASAVISLRLYVRSGDGPGSALVGDREFDPGIVTRLPGGRPDV